MRLKHVWKLVAVILVGILLSASSCDEKGLGDAPVGDQLEEPRTVIVMPDTFPNLVIVCDGDTRLYVTTREAAPLAVPNHPLCKGEPALDEKAN